MTSLLRKCGGLLLVLTVAFGLIGATPPQGSQNRGENSTKSPSSRVVRVTPPEVKSAVEVSVATNPANPDHLIGVSIARSKDHPGITDFAYVSNNAGRSWKIIPGANPPRTAAPRMVR